jgi:hypothetical protein
LILFAAPVAQAQLSKVCTTIKELGPNQYKNNSPIRAQNGNNASPITRFAENPTIIFIVGNPAQLGSANVYDSNGNYLTSGIRLSCDARGRGTCNARYKGSERKPNDTRSIRRKAVSKTKSPAIFWRVSSKGLCYRIPDAGKCYNVKSRGLCDGRILR